MLYIFHAYVCVFDYLVGWKFCFPKCILMSLIPRTIHFALSHALYLFYKIFDVIGHSLHFTLSLYFRLTCLKDYSKYVIFLAFLKYASWFSFYFWTFLERPFRLRKQWNIVSGSTEFVWMRNRKKPVFLVFPDPYTRIMSVNIISIVFFQH